MDDRERAAIAAAIQHTLIARAVTREQLERHCRECVELRVNAAMVAPTWVAEARRALRGSGVKVASAVDFPLGVMTTAGKVAEARALVAAGADELDVGVDLGRLLSGDEAGFRDDLAAVVRAAASVPVKVMLELPLLPAQVRERAVDLAVLAGARWVKNASSGDVGVADPADIAFLRARVPAGVGVKASGGIATLEQVRALLAAGADLVGTSHGAAILAGHGVPVTAAY